MSEKNSRLIPVQKYGEGDQVIIMIPGGPGLSYHYLEPLAKELASKDFQTWIFEPSGYPNNDPGFLPDAVEYYGLELSQLLDEYKLHNPILYGQSIGGAIVLEFLTKHPDYAGKVILSNTFPSVAFLKTGIQDRFQNFPEAAQNSYRKSKEEGDLAGIGQILMTEWVPHHLCRLPELPQPVLISMGQMNDNPLQNHFLGTDLFDIQGVVTAWDVMDDLPQITADVLCISGEFDYLNEPLNLEWMEKLPNAQISFVPESSHLSYFENNSNYMQILNEFIRK